MPGNRESAHIILEFTSEQEGNTGVVRYDTDQWNRFQKPHLNNRLWIHNSKIKKERLRLCKQLQIIHKGSKTKII